MTDFRLKVPGDVFHVIGTITEHADFAPVLKATRHPVAVNFQGTVQVSSAGAMKLRDLVLAMPDDGLAFHECPPFLIELFNMIPDLTRMRGHAVRIVSLYAPYTCGSCQLSTDVLKAGAEITKVGEMAHARPEPLPSVRERPQPGRRRAGPLPLSARLSAGRGDILFPPVPEGRPESRRFYFDATGFMIFA